MIITVYRSKFFRIVRRGTSALISILVVIYVIYTKSNVRQKKSKKSCVKYIDNCLKINPAILSLINAKLYHNLRQYQYQNCIKSIIESIIKNQSNVSINNIDTPVSLYEQQTSI